MNFQMEVCLLFCFTVFYTICFALKLVILQIMAFTQKWLTAWLFDNVLESDGKMNHCLLFTVSSEHCKSLLTCSAPPIIFFVHAHYPVPGI